MEKAVRVVLIPVDRYSNGKKIADLIQGEMFSSSADARKFAESKGVGRDEGNGDAFDHLEIAVYGMAEFMDDCNEQQINLEHFWVSYIYLK